MLAKAHVHVRGKSRASGTSTGGEFGGDVWVRSGEVMPFSCGVSVRVVSAPASFVGSISWSWLKSSLGVEKSKQLKRNSFYKEVIYIPK